MVDSFKLEGHVNFRERIAISIFSQKKILITQIRKNFFLSGLRKYEIDLLSLTDKLTHESYIQINEAGTIICFNPGNLLDSNVLQKISSLRPLSYYLEFIFYLILLNERRTEIKLLGLRALNLDISVENLIYVIIPLFRKLGIKEIRIKIFTNFFSSKINTELILFSSRFSPKKDFHITQAGILTKLRLIFTFSSNFITFINQLENLFDDYFNLSRMDYKFYKVKIPNKNIQFKTFSLIGESSTGCILGGDFTLVSFGQRNSFIKNKIFKIYQTILDEFDSGSCISGQNQFFLLFKMLIAGKSNQRSICLGKLTIKAIQFFRDIKRIFGIFFCIRPFYNKKTILIKLI
ncbi:RNA 3'phosphate cyclase (nucleomorph) [Chroomonas mesostigmatica CCMP1168]|uniref:RNA 3'phosphate cyclase n=1 Tax=Chroomonas mesostigmatica CCMP1168 TaxID=1195612 RepID=J7GA11_9CRYP|nr:RNA 3'phosphate cyclase [Chroomonas mesostigmatica CCMP1168]